MENLKIGILGGGQLGAMLIRHAIDFGLQVSVMDKDPNAPSARYTSSFYCGDPASYEDVCSFGRYLDIITIEKEAVNTSALRHLAATGVKVFPSPDTIDIIQDKYIQKQFLEQHEMPVARGISIENRAALHGHIEKFPVCLKKRRNGYDGFGVQILRNAGDIATAFDEPSVLEELIDIQQEISVIVARNPRGEIKCYDPVVMVFDKQRHILDYQLAPAHLDEDKIVQAKEMATAIARATNLAGILAVEMFITAQGQLLVNELAPRPHNSGHHTIEAAATSQYEQHLRAILDLPLGDTSIRQQSLMVNILEKHEGGKLDRDSIMQQILRMPGVHLHWYGKAESKAGRKLGHVTITGQNMKTAISQAEQVRNILNS